MNATDKAVRVVKFGGSLLDWPGSLPKLADWLRRNHRGFRNVLIVGGGNRVERLRRDCERGSLDDVTAHWQAIRIMDEQLTCVHFALFDLLPEEVEWDAAFNCERFLREIEPHLAGEKLPIGWSVTSDSIAARVAHYLQAEELVLLKSANPIGTDPQAWAGAGYVDAFFPTAARGLNIRAVNLRGD